MSSAVKSTIDEAGKKKARRLFFVGLADISWRLGASILAPILLGAWLDERRGGGNLFTLIGLLLGLVAAGLVIKNSFEKLNRQINDK